MTIRNFENDTPHIAATAYVDPLAVVIGQVTLADYVSVWPYAIIRGDVHSITVGARTSVQDGVMLHVTSDSVYCPGGRPLIIGEDITIGHHAVLHACTIEHHCLIGIGAIVLDGAILPPYTLLAAGSLVPPNKVLEGGFLWRGNPVQKGRPLTPSEHDFLDHSAKHYARLAERYQRQYATELSQIVP